MIRIKPIKRQFPGNGFRDSLLLYNAEQGSVFIKDTGRAGERERWVELSNIITT